MSDKPYSLGDWFTGAQGYQDGAVWIHADYRYVHIMPIHGRYELRRDPVLPNATVVASFDDLDTAKSAYLLMPKGNL